MIRSPVHWWPRIAVAKVSRSPNGSHDMQMMCEFTGERVEGVEVGIELIVTVVRADETTVAKPLEDSGNRVAAVVAPVVDLGNRS